MVFLELGEAEDDDRAVVFERFAPAARNRLETRHRSRGGRRRLNLLEGAANALDARARTALGSTLDDPVRDQDVAFVAVIWRVVGEKVRFAFPSASGSCTGPSSSLTSPLRAGERASTTEPS